MALRLYMDHDSLDRRVVDALRAAGVDVVTSDEAGNQRLSDHAQLEFSTNAGRALYSANCRDSRGFTPNGRRPAGSTAESSCGQTSG